ncbi:hypothetical protein BH24ACT9_BH24ACT9_09290 [soil metagenome]
MSDPGGDLRAISRSITALGDAVRRAAALHGLYAAVGLLVALFLPLAQVQFNSDDVPDRLTAFGLIFSASEYELDHSVLVPIAGVVLAGTVMTAVVAFLVAARRQDRMAATVALTASVILLPAVVVANTLFAFTESRADRATIR